MTVSLEPNTNKTPRIAVFSLRNLKNHVSRACGYTFENLIVEELDHAELIAPISSEVFQEKRHQSRIERGFHHIWNRGPQVEHIDLTCNYELFFFSAAQPRDLLQLQALKGWRKNSQTAVCWLQELWLKDFDGLGQVFSLLDQFDHVICSMHHCVAPLQARTSAKVTYLPWGVDTALFCPFPNPPKRVIDVCRIGESGDKTHTALVNYADQTGRYYYYDTIRGRHTMTSIVEHRRNYAGVLKRSRFFLSYLAKISRPDERATQEEFGLRYVEGVAAGTVLLGHNVSNSAFQEHFGWTDAVIETEFNSETVVEIIRSLEADEDRINEIRKNNVIQALNRHDHLHRWEKILELANLKAISKLHGRKEYLTALSRTVSS